MAEKETKTSIKTIETETDLPVTPPTKRDTKITDEAKVAKKSSWVVWLVIACVVVALLIAGGAVALIRAVHTNRPNGSYNVTGTTTLRQRFIPRQQFVYSTQTSTSGPTTSTTTTTYTYTQGVVTAVNSGSIMVAGNGKSQTIKTTSTTTYDSSKPAVNDSVVIVGTSDSSGVITATEINVTNG
jgi:hypothetical protein